MTTYLLDANVLIALTIAEHEHHDRATRWAAQVDRLALSPIVEGALVRFLVRIGESIGAATELLHEIKHHPRCDFWPDSLSYAAADLAHVRGHRQLTDAYLASLAEANGGLLATFDAALAHAIPDTVVLV
ncbi:PIN domain-containing protein [Mycolicibacter sp. MYC123]|uniref:Ribonuclease VapC n=1 Tax=[Mycobacterium] zoologicum TaxID=2872311 RepID=A0ABU5YMI9_9MYCO|nr:MULTISPECIES: PIN domain-containing protein [unclassified Mycolicibacter]MEB3050980.1 PIN domain-containing protein [Mycolicibacter sp. MYC123]MEB3063927.1 PIN domain-containing protein [Mycolicibacter sp. MYC101]